MLIFPPERGISSHSYGVYRITNDWIGSNPLSDHIILIMITYLPKTVGRGEFVIDDGRVFIGQSWSAAPFTPFGGREGFPAKSLE